jgi:hypothetical protein
MIFKNMTQYIFIILLFCFPILTYAQDKPVLDSTYLANEVNAFINSLSEPKEKLFAVYLLSGMNITNAIHGTRFGTADLGAGSNKQYQAQSGFLVDSGLLLQLAKRSELGFGISYLKSS